MNAIALFLALTLAWTFPSTRNDGGPLNCPLSWHVYRLAGQSPTYKAHEAIMRLGTKSALPDSFAVYWPQVVRECAPRLVRSGTFGLEQRGQTYTLALPDSFGGSLWIVTTSSTGGESTWSNIVAK